MSPECCLGTDGPGPTGRPMLAMAASMSTPAGQCGLWPDGPAGPAARARAIAYSQAVSGQQCSYISMACRTGVVASGRPARRPVVTRKELDLA